MKALSLLAVFPLLAFISPQDAPPNAVPVDPVEQRLETSPRHHE